MSNCKIHLRCRFCGRRETVEGHTPAAARAIAERAGWVVQPLGPHHCPDLTCGGVS